MTLLINDLTFSQDNFHQLFPLEMGENVIAGGKRAGQTAAMARYTVMAGKEGREHIIEIGYGTVPERDGKKQDYPLLLPKLDSQLGRFNIDGNTNNVLILKFREEAGRKLALHALRNFNAPCEIAVTPGQPTEKLALAVLEVVQHRIGEIRSGKINTAQDPQIFINMIHHAIEMRVGHMLRAQAG